MPKYGSLDLSDYGNRQPDLFLPPRPSVEAEHLDWCRALGLSPREIIESVGRKWPLSPSPDYGDALVVLTRARRMLKRIPDPAKGHAHAGTTAPSGA